MKIHKTVNWKLERDGRTVGELRPAEGRLLVLANGEQVGGPFATIEEAVAAVPALRALDSPGTWVLTTTLPSGKAGFMLDDPAEGIEGLAVNGQWWLSTTNGNERFLVPDDTPQDGLEEIDLLCVYVKLPGGVANGWWVKRWGQVCQLTEVQEVLVGGVWVREANDLDACLRLAGDIVGPVAQLVRGSLLSTASEDGISSLISRLRTPFANVMWVDGKPWLEGRPAPHDQQRSLSGQPVRLSVESEEHLAVPETDPPPPPPTGPSRQARPQPPLRVIWRRLWHSGPLTEIPTGSLPKALWFAVVSFEPRETKRLLAADFTRNDNDDDDGERFGVIVETEDSCTYLGFVVDDRDAALLYASAFGGVVIAGDDRKLLELASDGSVVRG